MARFSVTPMSVSATTEETLSGFATLAAHFYPPISAAWSERLKQLARRSLLGGLFVKQSRNGARPKEIA